MHYPEWENLSQYLENWDHSGGISFRNVFGLEGHQDYRNRLINYWP